MFWRHRGSWVSFGMTTTAEVVETEEQMRCLNLEGCIEEFRDIFIANPYRLTKSSKFLKIWPRAHPENSLS